MTAKTNGKVDPLDAEVQQALLTLRTDPVKRKKARSQARRVAKQVLRELEA